MPQIQTATSSYEHDPIDACLRDFRVACAGQTPPSVVGLRGWLDRVPTDHRPNLLVDLVTIHLACAWDITDRPTPEQYVAEFGRDFREFSSLSTLPSEVFVADLSARYEFNPLWERRTIAEYAEQYDRPDVAELSPESVVGESGRYLKLSFLGDGGMGAVWKCHDQHLLRLAAVKIPHEWVIRNPRNRERLVQEARLTAVLNHPGIVSVYEFDESDPDRPFYVMRLVTGETLQERIHAHVNSGGGRHGLRELLQTLVAVCDTVAYAHSQGVLHRDLKPNNVKTGAFGEVTVLDWGLVKLHPTGDGAATDLLSANGTHTATDTPVGLPGLTPPDAESSGLVGAAAYMPPEHVRGKSTPHSDVFGLGAILYEILTGRPPYAPAQGESRVALLKRVEGAEFQTPRQVAGRAVPRALEAICLKAMARSPEDRYTSPKAMAADLGKWLADERVRAHREWPHHKLFRLVRRHTGVSILLALLLIAAGAGAWLWQQNRADRTRAAERELDDRALDAENELNVIDGLVGAGKLDPARTALAGLDARLDGPDRLRSHRERAQRTLNLVETRSQLTREREIRIPEFYRQADEAEFHLLGAYWTLLPHEETKTARRIDFPEPRGPDLGKGIEVARQALAMYGLPQSGEAFRVMREAGLAEETVTRLQRRAGELLFLWSTAVERVAQGGPVDRHAAASYEALALLDVAGRMGNDSKSLHLHRAVILSKLGDEARAKAAREVAEQRLDATFLDLHFRATIHARKKEREQAVAVFQQALVIRPRDYWTLFRLAKALEGTAVEKRDPAILGQVEATYATCIGLRPDDPTAYNNRADVLYQLAMFAKAARAPEVAARRLREAVTASEKTLSVDPTYLMAWGNLTLAHAEQQDSAAVEEVLRRFTEHPQLDRDSQAGRREHARVLANVALAYERLERYKEAAEYDSRSLELSPDDAGTLHNRAVAREKLQQFEGAEADIRKALALRPEDGEYYFLLGNILQARRSKTDAVRAFDRAIELKPNLWKAWYNRGVVLRQLNRNKEARRDQTQVIKNKPDYALAYYERAMLKAIAGEFSAALDDVDGFLALEPNDVEVLSLRGQIYGDLGKDTQLAQSQVLKRSEADFTRAIQLAPIDHGAHRSRGLTRYRAEDWTGAIADYRDYLRLNPQARDAPSILNDIAVAHENSGQIDEALKVFGEALALGRTTSLLGNRGNLYLRQGDLRRATADLDDAIKLDKGDDRAWGLRAQVRLRSEDWAGAIADFDQADKLFPGHYETLTLRGFAHYAAGDAAAARKDWARVVKDRPGHVRGKFCRGATALLDGKPASSVEGLALALGDSVLAPYAVFLLARAWAELPGPGPGKAGEYGEKLVHLRPNEWAAYLEAARIHARASALTDGDNAMALRDRALELLGEAVKRQSEIRKKLVDTSFEPIRKDPRFPK